MSANRHALHSSAVTATVNGVETGVADLGVEGYFHVFGSSILQFCISVSISIMFWFSHSSLIYVCISFCVFSNNVETGIADLPVNGQCFMFISLIRLVCHSMPPPTFPE
jgi:hypothetical protein